MVGYESYTKDINLLPGKRLELMIELNSSLDILNEIELVEKEDKRWEKQFKQFKRELLGDTPNAKKCEITNPWIVDFEEDRRKNTFKAHANQPLIIHNNALGYKISFLLIRFEKLNGRLFYVGYPSFDTLNITNSDQFKSFKRNREDTYNGSLKHFFFALIHKRLEDEGFMLYRISNGFEDRRHQSLNEAVSHNYFNPVEIAEVVSSPDPWGNYTIYISEMLEIIYTKKEWKDSYYLGAPYQVSRIVLNDRLVVTENGYVFNPYSFVVSGYLSEERLANMLPFEYGLE